MAAFSRREKETQHRTTTTSSAPSITTTTTVIPATMSAATTSNSTTTKTATSTTVAVAGVGDGDGVDTGLHETSSTRVHPAAPGFTVCHRLACGGCSLLASLCNVIMYSLIFLEW